MFSRKGKRSGEPANPFAKKQKKEKSENGKAEHKLATGDELAKLSAGWKNGDQTEIENAAVMSVPVSSCVLDGVFDSELLKSVKDELEDGEWVHRSAAEKELLESSEDLEKLDAPGISALRSALFDGLKSFVGQVSGLELDGEIDLSVLRVPQNGYFVCHTDDLQPSEDGKKGRRIQFIVFLVPEGWSDEHGARIQLYAQNEQGQPTEVAHTIVPAFGRIAFFDSPNTYYRISENLANMDATLISGYLHGPLPESSSQPTTAATATDGFKPLNETPVDLTAWINPDWLSDDATRKLKKGFLKSSESLLRSFLLPEKLSEIQSQLSTLEPAQVGPPNLRSFGVSTPEPGSPVGELMGLLASKEFTSLLARITNLDLRSSHTELRHLDSGSYTLPSAASEKGQLDLVLSFFEGKWGKEWGGEFHFLSLVPLLSLSDADDAEEAEEEDAELLITPPVHNALGLVYREPGVSSYIKYLNHKTEVSRWDLVVSFEVAEVEGEEEEEEDEESEGEEEEEEDEGEEGEEGEDGDGFIIEEDEEEEAGKE